VGFVLTSPAAMGKIAFLWPSLMISTIAIIFGHELSSSALRIAAVRTIFLLMKKHVNTRLLLLI
jgi:hypothetical protein